jgi:solute carrier family 44 protein 1 (choline transporter-like protein)
MLGMAGITFLTGLNNGWTRIYYGYDSYGNICDKQTQKNNTGQNTLGLRSVLYFDFKNPVSSKKVCVKSCPDRTIASVDDYKRWSAQNNVSLCFYSILAGAYDANECPTKFPLVQSESIGHRCVPNVEAYLSMHLNFTLTTSDHLNMAVVQLKEHYENVILLSLAALVITVILVFSLRYIAKVMIPAILLLTSLGFIGLSTFLWIKYVEVTKSSSASPSTIITTTTTIPFIGIELENDTLYLTSAILASSFTLVIVLILIAMRKRIGLVIRLFAEAQKALTSQPGLFVVPFATFTVLVMFLAYWVSTSFLIYGWSQLDNNSNKSDLLLFNLTIKRQHLTRVIWAYQFVGLIWITEFIFACQSMVVTGSVAKWYFTRDKSRFSSSIFRSITSLVVYHMGSAALGSFLIALVKIPRYLLMLVQDKIKASGSSTASYVSKCCICCLWCLEKFIKFINSNAYTIIAIEGVSFCTAAQKAFMIVAENALRMTAINSVGDFMLFLSKVTVAALTSALGIYVMDIPINDFETSKFKALPLLLVFVISYLIAHCFFTVYEMVIDAVMVCFCEDCKANDGSEDRPYYMSNSLKEFVDSTSSTTITINN